MFINLQNKKKIIPKKHLSQYFLKDKTIINNIISHINPQIKQSFIEIGPGLGSLTFEITKIIDKLTVIEIDPYLTKYLLTHPELQNKLTIIENNVLFVDFLLIYKNLKNKLRIFGNLPYNISTPLLFHMLKYREIIQDMHFLLQKELVDRLISTNNSKCYGRLSIIMQLFFIITPILNIAPQFFKPTPKVYSTLIRLEPHKKISYNIKNIKYLFLITKLAFQQRRKTILNSLNKLLKKKELLQNQIDISSRAENLSIQDYCKLSNFLYEKIHK